MIFIRKKIINAVKNKSVKVYTQVYTQKQIHTIIVVIIVLCIIIPYEFWHLFAHDMATSMQFPSTSRVGGKSKCSGFVI